MYAGVYGYRVGEESETVSEWSGQDLHSCRSPRPSPRGCNDGIALGPHGCNCASRFTSSQSHRGCNCASQTKKACSASIQSARQGRWRNESSWITDLIRRITNHAGTRTDSFRSLERKPDADCGRGRLFHRFRLTSCSAASGGSRLPFCTGTSRGCNCASQAEKACSASIQTARQRIIRQ